MTEQEVREAKARAEAPLPGRLVSSLTPRPHACPACGGPVAPAGCRRERVAGGPWREWLYWRCESRRCGKIVAKEVTS